MAAVASQLCVLQASTHSWTVSSTTKAVKLNRFHLFFIYNSTSFSSSEEHSFCSMPTYCTDRYLSTQSTEVGLWLSLRRRSRPFVAFKFIYFKYIYTPEKSYS